MSGRKVFTAGEVLQAADVNDYLMDQSVMVFAGTAARGSAIPSPTEGMVTYRSDDDVVEVFDGSAFVGVGGGLVEVKSAIFTGTQVSSSVAASGNVTVTDLSITHAAANASNKFIISAYFGAAGNSNSFGNVGIAVHDGTNLIGVGATAGSRTSLGAGGFVSTTASVGGGLVMAMPSVSFVYTPGDTSSRTFTVRAINVASSSQTLYINRSENDTDDGNNPRAASSLVIQEVSV